MCYFKRRNKKSSGLFRWSTATRICSWGIEKLGCSWIIYVLVSLGLLPRLVYALKLGSLGAHKAVASAICLIGSSTEMKRIVGESRCIPLLIKMLEAKSNNAREDAAQAISSLMTLSHREVQRDNKSVPNFVVLRYPSSMSP
ncbi:protein ARABIDILLO 2-like [Forsythia ovata]|uniref:Protein ARABIDILLO 2-like n=1 Tax=Forsythia ovata TaxID=205694 RepID=A0ABD1WL45_9LAMI